MSVRSPAWMRWVLVLAGVYNLVWGTWVVLFPLSVFEVAGLEPPRYVSIWQCVGMIVGVYGVGYLAASRDPARHWPIVLVGLLGKVFGPIGFVMAASRGELPWSFGFTIATNDLIWWVPFGAMLWHAARSAGAAPGEAIDFDGAIEGARDQNGVSLREHSDERAVLVVFLRHSGCTFCKEALADLRGRRAAIEALGAGIALVHMSSEERAAAWLDGAGLGDVPRFADPERVLYRAFGLERGRFGELFGLRVWWRGLLATARGHLVGKLDGDGFQMPGAFVLERGKIVRAFRHAHAAQRPDYEGLACGVPA